MVKSKFGPSFNTFPICVRQACVSLYAHQMASATAAPPPVEIRPLSGGGGGGGGRQSIKANACKQERGKGRTTRAREAHTAAVPLCIVEIMVRGGGEQSGHFKYRATHFGSLEEYVLQATS